MPENQLPVWNKELGEALPGAKVLISVRNGAADAPDGAAAAFWGIVVAASPKEGIVVALEGSRKGETYIAPPDHRAIRKGREGVYTISKTGETVENPDFVISWVVNRGPAPPQAALQAVEEPK